jgi:cullin 4
VRIFYRPEITGVSDSYGTEPAELKRVLQSLACGKKKVLKKTPAGREVDDNDVFHYNGEFTDPKYKVHISSILAQDTVRVELP